MIGFTVAAGTIVACQSQTLLLAWGTERLGAESPAFRGKTGAGEAAVG